MEMDAEALEAWKHKAKAHLRKQARAVRGAMSRSAIEQRSRALVEKLASLRIVEEAKSVALFFPIEGKNEVDLRALDKRLRERGVEVAYPAIETETETETATESRDRPPTPKMVFRFVADVDKMEERGFGFSEPSPSDPIAERIDVIVVPALAVDMRGHRIGYGAGYYDRTLPSYVPPGQSVVVAFDFQLVAEVPASARDVRSAWVVTDMRVVETRDEL